MAETPFIAETATSLNSAGQALSDGKVVRIVVGEEDMRPFFREGKDFVIVAPIRSASQEDAAVVRHNKVAERKRPTNRSKGKDRLTVRRRDIVVFKHDDDVLLHRVVHIWGTLLLLRGDSSYNALERATVSDVMGIVISGSIFNGHSFVASSAFWRILSRAWCSTYRLRYWLNRTHRK